MQTPVCFKTCLLALKFDFKINFIFQKVQTVAVRCIQRNSRSYFDRKKWPWWKLFTQIIPLIETHKTDLELKNSKVNTTSPIFKFSNGPLPELDPLHFLKIVKMLNWNKTWVNREEKGQGSQNQKIPHRNTGQGWTGRCVDPSKGVNIKAQNFRFGSSLRIEFKINLLIQSEIEELKIKLQQIQNEKDHFKEQAEKYELKVKFMVFIICGCTLIYQK